MSLLTARELTYRTRGGSILLHPLSLELEPGSFWLVLGANGAGKTTLLRLLSGLLPPSGGEIHLHGHPLATCSERFRARHLSYLPQQWHSALPLTVEEVLLSGRYARHGLWGGSRAEDLRALQEIAGQLGISPLLPRLTSEISGGEAQKMLLGAALLQEPEILLYDEPYNHLDPLGAHGLTRTMTALHQGRLTQMVVSHHVTPLLPLTTHLLCLRGGHTLYCGPRPPAERLPHILQETFSIPFVACPAPLQDILIPQPS